MPLPYSLDLTRLACEYTTGALTPTQVMSDVLREIEATRSNAVWLDVLPPDTVLARARNLEQRRGSGEALPLYGVPFAVKDNIDVAGRQTTAACPAFAYTAARSAHVVSRLEAAGALLVGKTNLDQFATGLAGTRSPYGACRNPFDGRYISGGSSSGSAVAVSVGQVSFALGTDTAGSGRVPASFCNIVGIKPTRGLIGTSGVVPACRSLDCVSIFALTVHDAAAVLEAASGTDDDDPYSRPPSWSAARELRAAIRRTSGAPLVFGVPRAADREFFGDALAEKTYCRALDRVTDSGAEVVEIDFAPYAETARLLYEGPWVAERLLAIKAFFERSPDALYPITREIIATGVRYSAVDTFDAQYRLEALRKRCAADWSAIDVLLVPSTGSIYTLEALAAEPVKLNTNLGYYTNFVNLLDLCAIAVPTGFRDDGLPAGVTLIAPAFEDAALGEFAAPLQNARLGATRFAMPDNAPIVRQRARGETVQLAVVGAHLSGLPLNGQLVSRGARLIEACTTAPHYRLYALPHATPPRPGLARVANGRGTAIDAELWEVPIGAFGSFVAEVPSPLAIGTVTLTDGRDVKGFLCESYALNGARDISSYGGWRRYLRETCGR